MGFKPFPVISGKNDMVLPALDGVFISSPKKNDMFFYVVSPFSPPLGTAFLESW